ncbi:ABC transporter ATP-binding protein [Roseovarius aestuarii]|uniref:Ribose import ATP-binding protein RbsA n=1 Tax=Roseovarius aestuarii TaxID=475083 RepID=A0A1X7BLS4_9RHOB|nr:ABC transporter ATP-binding protein [Roseovarius aestuarii]SMC10575.1 Ribose import ATP-binding protein RbsA [Roseovarius aestuarii]
MTATEKTGGGASASYALELKGVNKSFGLIRANRNINLAVRPGTIHGIIGENGAGKSTLMNIVYGMHTRDDGEILIDGERVDMRSSADAISHGVGMVHQHFMLVPTFTVLENVMLGTEGGALLREGREAARARIVELSERYNLAISPDALVSDLNVGQRQRVEIIKALKGGAKILILDEPTGVLTPQEAEQLFEVLKVLRDRGVAVLLITHKLAEIMEITDAVDIMRQGEIVGHRKTAQTSPAELAELMVGREVLLEVERTEVSPPGDVRFSASHLGYTSSQGVVELDDISFEVRSGEILGVAGVSGNGQTQLMEVLAGMRHLTAGAINILGTEVTPASETNPRIIRDVGVRHIPEDRHTHGLILHFEARENMILGLQDSDLTGTGLLMDQDAIEANCRAKMKDYDVRPSEPRHFAKNFSGGNQQKIVIAREFSAHPVVLLVGQPTRGVDVGAIEFIHKQLLALRDAGCAILLVSVELDEIMSLSDRIMVLCGGKNVGIVSRDEADRQTLGLMMAGQKRTGEAA